MRRIVFLAHRHGNFMAAPYYAHAVGVLLRREGVEVVVAHGPGKHVDADLAFLHVDLTVVPDDHMAVLRDYPVVINGAVRDISKRHINRVTRLQLQQGDAHDGQVIIKPNLNCGGWVEADLSKKGLLPGSHRYISDYPVVDSIDQVDEKVWQDPNLVVERFRPEVVDGLYRLRLWKFLGNAETNTFVYSKTPVVKGRTVFRREEVGEKVPEELRQMRQELGFDFGKFDYAIVDGQVVLYDVNRTPTYSRPLDEEMPRLVAFKEALKAFCK